MKVTKLDEIRGISLGSLTKKFKSQQVLIELYQLEESFEDSSQSE